MLDKKRGKTVIDGLNEIISGVNKILEVDGDVNEILLIDGYEEVAPHEHIFPNLSLDEWVMVLYDYRDFIEEKLIKEE